MSKFPIGLIAAHCFIVYLLAACFVLWEEIHCPLPHRSATDAIAVFAVWEVSIPAVVIAGLIVQPIRTCTL
jgi:hypothetical protein